MRTFLEEVVSDIVSEKVVSDDLVLVVPSKRAGLFLLQVFAKTSTQPGFAPTIYTIEEFVGHISGLDYASNTQLIFELYQVYKSLHGDDADSFQDFSRWGNTLLQDFNEIDRYLIPQKKLFSYLSAIQETNHWYLKPEKTPMIEAYIKFWNSLGPLYDQFSQHLISQKKGYQGLIYRKASENIHEYTSQSEKGSHVFIGFNALNSAESTIIQSLIDQDRAEIYWDIDPFFVEDPIHDAGYFIRSYLKNWPHFQKNPLRGPVSNYLGQKDINIIGVPRNVSQAKYVGSLLDTLIKDDECTQQSTAVILGDENLLNPLVNAIPDSVPALNITMGLPLSHTPATSLFIEFISLYVNSAGRGWYYSDVISFVSHPYVKRLFKKPESTLNLLYQEIREKNRVYIQPEQIHRLSEEDSKILELLFSRDYTSPQKLHDANLQLAQALKNCFESFGDSIALEYLVKIKTVLNEIGLCLDKYDFIVDLKSFQSLFRELTNVETLDFYGKPLEGIQLMGMLESRNLDFETVIITSLNEGILPSGKTSGSFIPFDLKREFKMPTYKEKDAVYTYHFYRLLQRAKNIYLIYNTEPDVLEGGEKSRFISQLLTENRAQGSITQIIATPPMHLVIPDNKSISKDTSVVSALSERANKGFSPSSLSSYIRDPIEFYKKYVLGIREFEEVEENIAANTFGTIIHHSLEQLYLPLVGSTLSPEALRELKPKIPDMVNASFKEHYPTVSLLDGKNLIAYSVIQRYLERFLELEIESCKNHKIELLAVEQKLRTSIEVQGLNFPVALKGTIDRIDKKDGVLRILDYKTGNTKSTEVEITTWESIISDPDKGKAFQMMSYALMYYDKYPTENFEAAIIPFRDLDSSPLRFCTKENGGRYAKKEFSITAETISEFRTQLQQLILTIFDQEIAFETPLS
ncbi:PD-(D/E)XK nuclease family protein [Muriicola soli]|uniref:PD-(D/E)XK nuclease family protein n=1 Tax=Muriicola soli TaxID=2507538 RepID=A0A411EC06_9FLAO|nr:PD-(D/E)XK nuclease family protein [Muriicola soli]QBA65271.1 PD-(D/E)XK nuclease family protein [Muriicola soli]